MLSLCQRHASIVIEGMPLGSTAPDFELPEPLTGKVWKLADFEGHPALLVTFICNHCPFVVHLKKDIVKLANDYMPRGLAIAAISSNSAVTHPQDGPDFMAEDARTFEYTFPYLYDETQEVARAYGAVALLNFTCSRRMEISHLSLLIMDNSTIPDQITTNLLQEVT